MDCDSEDREKARMASCCCLATVMLIGVILFSVSFDTLDPHQVGIKYNNNLVTLDTRRPYDNGRYFLGLGLSFIKFPTNMRIMDFAGGPLNSQVGRSIKNSVRAWTSNGQTVELEVSFWYRIQRSTIFDLYFRYGKDYDNRFRQIALRALKETTPEFATTQFFTNRTQIGLALRNNLRLRMAKEFVSVEIFNLRKIDIPPRFEEKVIAKVVTAQQGITASEQKKNDEQSAQISVVKGSATANVTKILSVAKGTALVLTEGAKARGKFVVRNQEAESYAALNSTLGITGNSVLGYRWALLMSSLEKNVAASHEDLQFAVGFSNPLLQLQRAG